MTWALLSVPITCISSENHWVRGCFLLTNSSQCLYCDTYLEENETETEGGHQRPEARISKNYCAKKTQVHLRLAEVPGDPSLQINNFLFKFVQNKKSLEQDKMTFRIVLRQSCAIFCRNFQICYWRIYHEICGFAICGLAHVIILADLR